MLNSRSSRNKKHRVLKVLQVKDMKIGFSNKTKNFKKEQPKKIIEEQTLAEYVKDKNFLEPKEVYDITLGICETISYLNSLNYPITCSQLNPTNLIITKNKNILLKNTDFSNELQVNRENVIYTVGMIMYFMASGKAPTTNFGPLLDDSYGINVDNNLKRIIQKCLDVDVKRRYVSLEELKKEIIIELLIKSKYAKSADLNGSKNASNQLNGDSRLKRADKRKSKRGLNYLVSRFCAALSMILFT